MYAVAARLDPDTYLALARADLRRDGAGRRHRGRRVPLPAPRARRRARTPTRTRWAEALVAGRRRRRASGSPCSTPATSPAARGRHAARRARSCGSATARRRRAGPTRVAALRRRAGLRVGAAVHSVRAVPRDAAARRSPRRPRGRPLHVHLSEQPAENERLPGRATAARRPRLLADRGVLGPAHDRRARHPPDRRRHRAARRHAAPAVCLCPTTERDLADGIGPAARAARRRAPALPSAATARRDRPVRGGPGAWSCDERLATGERGHFTPAELLDAATAPATRASAGPTPGRLAVGARADLVAVRLDTAAHRRARDPAQRRVRRDRRRRRHRRGRRRGSSSRAGGTCSATSARLLADRDRAAVGGRDEPRRASPGIGELVTNARPAGDGPLGSHDAALVVEDGRGRLGRARARTRPAADRRIDVGGARGDPRLRRQPHPPGLRRRPGGRVRGPDGRRARTPAAASAPRSPPPGRPTDDELRARLRRAGRRDARAGHHDRRDQERLRPHRRATRRARCASPREVTAETTFLGAHVVPPSTRTARRVRRPGHRPDARRLRPARPVGRRVLRAGARRVRRRPGPRGPRAPAAAAGPGPAGARQPARPPARACGSPSSSAPPASTTAPT